MGCGCYITVAHTYTWGLRVQIEGSGKLLLGITGDIGLNIVYNRISGELAGNVDWTGGGGAGISVGVSGTVGRSLGGDPMM